MKLQSKIVIPIILFIFAVSAIYIVEHKKYEPKIKDVSTHQIDSLKQVIKSYDILIARYDNKLDSLYSSKAKINNYYETTIKDFSNPAIVSNDSINNYISSKLYIKR